MSHSAIESVVAKARQSLGELWAELAEASGIEALSAGTLGLHLGQAGGLASAHLVSGHRAKPGERAPAGRKLVAGRDSKQQKRTDGIIGVELAHAAYESAGATAVRLAGSPAGSYYLLARYD